MAKLLLSRIIQRSQISQIRVVEKLNNTVKREQSHITEIHLCTSSQACSAGRAENVTIHKQTSQLEKKYISKLGNLLNDIPSKQFIFT